MEKLAEIYFEECSLKEGFDSLLSLQGHLVEWWINWAPSLLVGPERFNSA